MSDSDRPEREHNYLDPYVEAAEEERRNWRLPSQPEAVVGLIAQFARITAETHGPIVFSSSPSWFDDVAFAPIQSVLVAGESVTAGLYNYFGTEDDFDNQIAQEVPDLIKRYDNHEFKDFLAAAFDAMKANGTLGRNLIEDAIHPLEAEEIVSFMRIPCTNGDPARILLSVTHSNGWTDVAYEADPEGRLMVWSPAGFEETLKDSTAPTEFSLPKLSAATVVDSVAPRTAGPG